MASPRRRGRRGGAAGIAQTILYREIVSVKGRALTILDAVEIAVVILVALVGFEIRLIPWGTVENVLASQLFSNIPRDLLQFGYLYGNDPWIEYWTANYLYQHGIGSWISLTRDNPATHIFWYPWGRDFVRSSYVFIPALTAVTYPLVQGLSLQQWIALIPPITSILMVVLGYVYARRLYGRLAGIAAALLLAFLPATLDRTHAGFVEKEGASLPFFILGLLLYSEALRTKNRILAVFAGVALGSLGFMWGGYLLAVFAYAATVILVPLFAEARERREILATNVVVGAALVATLLAASIVGKVSVKTVALLVAGSLAYSYLVPLLFEKIAPMLRPRLAVISSPTRLYLASLVLLLAISPIVLPMIGVGMRFLYAIYWPLRGTAHFTPLVESIAEHRPLYTAFFGDRGAIDSLQRLNIVLVLGPIGALVTLFYIVRREKAIQTLPIAILGGSLVYGVLGMAYLLQVAGVFGALASTAIFYPLARKEEHTRRRRREWSESEIRRAAIVLTLAIVILAAIANAYISYADMRGRIPSILTSNTIFVNPGWLELLDIIRSQLPRDAVVVTWWDYGYWVSVGASRATLADGATFNGTQIALLARMLVGNENTSVKLMRMLGLEPGKTYVLVHDVALYSNGTLVYMPIVGNRLLTIDLTKSYWMVRIAGYNVTDYFDVRRGLLVPTPLKPGTKEGVIYNILADAGYRLAETNTTLANIRPASVNAVYLNPLSSPDEVFTPSLKHFKPYKVVAHGIPVGGQQGGLTILYVVIALYEWTG